jgi:hypothetical protein
MTACTEQQNHAPRLLYDRPEAAFQLSMSVRSLDYAIAAKKIGTRRKGGRVLIPHSELVRYASTNDYDDLTPKSRKRKAAKDGEPIPSEDQECEEAA